MSQFISCTADIDTINSAAALHKVLDLRTSQQGTAVGYFYFDFNNVGKLSSRIAVRCLLVQVAGQTTDGQQSLLQLYERCENGRQQPSEESIRHLFGEVLASTSSTYLVLDALDECADRENLLEFICGLVDLKLTGVRLLTTSRAVQSIQKRLDRIATYKIDIHSAAVDKDIRIYVRDRLATDSKLMKWPQSVRDEILTVLMKKADGM